jgi:hypothetical protein
VLSGTWGKTTEGVARFVVVMAGYHCVKVIESFANRDFSMVHGMTTVWGNNQGDNLTTRSGYGLVEPTTGGVEMDDVRVTRAEAGGARRPVGSRGFWGG